MSEPKRVQQAISLSLSAHYQLDKEAFNLLCSISETEDPIKVVEVTLKKLEAQTERPLVISKSLLEETAKEMFIELEAAGSPSAPSVGSSLATKKISKSFHPLAREIEADIEVLEDPTDKICSTGSIKGYIEYFQDRFKRMKRLLQQRMDVRGAQTIRDAFQAATRSRIKVFCIVTEKRESRYGTILRIEDLESATAALIPQNASSELSEKAKSLLLDQVVCLSLAKSKKNLLVVQDLFFPDIPNKKPRKAKEPVFAALISDLHVGSKQFMREEFDRFVLWLNGKYGSNSLREVAGRVKYVIIAGDIVDGVGVYPNQIDELAVKDVYKQYDHSAKCIAQIPEYIELIVIPGNHDAPRKALPQPALQKKYAELLCETRKIISLGNPATVRIHGVEVLIYHGRSLDDVLATAADMDFHSPERAMRLLLKSRHLSPTYGQRTLIAPEKTDYLVIERVPDVFHTGHVHVMKYESYRGTLMINSGAWQKQTRYQRNLGLDPTPGIIPVVDLQTLAVLPIDFNS